MAMQARRCWRGCARLREGRRGNTSRSASMFKKDAQVHLCPRAPPPPPHRPTPYLVEDAIRDMDAAGIDGAILHPPVSWDPQANEQAVEAVLAYPKRFAILGYPVLDNPERRVE